MSSLPNAAAPRKETHQWWSARSAEACPTCNGSSDKVVQDSYTNMMYGAVVEKHCATCGQRWVLKIAEDPD